MKKIIISVLFLAVPVFASDWDCEITSTCLKSISPCEVNTLAANYSEFTKSVNAYAEFAWVWQLQKLCVSRKGKVMQYSVDGRDVEQTVGTMQVNEMRVPEKIEEVPSHYISDTENKALKKCQYARNNLMKIYEKCK
jgi:hypothetical protein